MTSQPLLPHQLAELFPPIEGVEREKLKESLSVNGQLEKIITLNGKILDGVNRQALITELGGTPEYLDYTELPMRLRGASPFQFVWAKNFGRRHLNAGQKAAVAAEALPYFQKEAAANSAANLKQNRPMPPKGGIGDEFNQDNGIRPEDESQVRGRGSAGAAARVTGASTRSVERATKLKKTDPKKFEQVKAGKLTLSKAERDEAKEKAAATALEDAYKRIEKVSGKLFAAMARDGEILKGKKEVLAFVALNDSDMAKCRGLIENGWTVARAKHYKMTDLSRTHSIGDLCVRTRALGGKFEIEMLVNGATFKIAVTQEPAAAALSSPGAPGA